MHIYTDVSYVYFVCIINVTRFCIGSVYWETRSSRYLILKYREGQTWKTHFIFVSWECQNCSISQPHHRYKEQKLPIKSDSCGAVCRSSSLSYQEEAWKRWSTQTNFLPYYWRSSSWGTSGSWWLLVQGESSFFSGVTCGVGYSGTVDSHALMLIG